MIPRTGLYAGLRSCRTGQSEVVSCETHFECCAGIHAQVRKTFDTALIVLRRSFLVRVFVREHVVCGGPGESGRIHEHGGGKIRRFTTSR